MRVLLMLSLLAACQRSPAIPIPTSAATNPDASIYQECGTVCVRPSDCATTYNDDGICPPGFRCARTFTCRRD